MLSFLPTVIFMNILPFCCMCLNAMNPPVLLTLYDDTATDVLLYVGANPFR